MKLIKKLIFVHQILFYSGLILSISVKKLQPWVDLQSSDDPDDKHEYFMFFITNHGENTDSETVTTESSDKESESIESMRSLAIPVHDVKEELPIADLKLNKEQKKLLRKRWNSSCDKKASKYCNKACRRAYKTVCESYQCMRRMKRMFKRECKKSCKSRFISSKYSSDSE